MATYFFTDDAAAERQDFMRRQGAYKGGEQAERALAAVSAVDEYARAMVDARNLFINLATYEAAEMRWAEDQYNLMVAAIASGAAQFAHAGMRLTADGGVSFSAEAIAALAEQDERDAR